MKPEHETKRRGPGCDGQVPTIPVVALAVVVLLGVFSRPAAAQPLTLEQFGGQAYYKRFDGKLTYTPYSADNSITKGTGLRGTGYTKITYTGPEDVFDARDLHKSFCGLFVHRNPGNVDYSHVDLYYPNIVGSRYSKVVRVLDGKDIIVDFEYNGGNREQPQVVTDRKGYVFFDNSAAWAKMMKEFCRPGNASTEIRLRPHRRKGVFHIAYVVPQYETVMPPDKEFKIWTGTSEKAWIKLGLEDYFQWDRHLGKPVYKQASHLFENNSYDRDIISHNVVWLPPHRTVPETSSFRRAFFGGYVHTGPCERIIAIIGNTALDEQREIEKAGGLTEEHIVPMGLGFMYSGGKYAGEGAGEDIVGYQYILLKDFEHAGPALISLKANNGAGNYLVMENVTTDLKDQEAWNPTSVLVKGRFTTDKSGFAKGIIERDYYPPEVFEITSGHSFYQVDNSYHILGWSNRANVIQVDRFVFLIGNNNTWASIYEPLFSEGKPKFNWKVPAKEFQSDSTYIRTGRKQLIAQRIPRKGRRYWISRDYTVTWPPDGIPCKVKKIFPDYVRGFANWSVILQKRISEINPKTDIPRNAKPIQLQAGDRFKIVGRGDTVYTVLTNDRGPWYQFTNEYHGDGHGGYLYSRHKLDKNLPADLPLAFEIEMVKSTSEYLLDGKVRPAYIIYKSNQFYRATLKSKFGDRNALHSDPLGHLMYNHKEFAWWAEDCRFVGFYRQSMPRSILTAKVKKLKMYSPGYTFINCSGLRGQFAWGMEDFLMRDKIRKALGKELPEDRKAKMRLFHCHDINTGVKGGARYVEIHETADDAPDMPAPCRRLLRELARTR